MCTSNESESCRRLGLTLGRVLAIAVLAIFILGEGVWARPLQQHEGDIVINEIMQNPSAVTDDNGEWFEIVNIGNSAIDINGWCIRDDGSDSHTINNGGSLSVLAGGYLVLGRNSDTGTNGGVTVDYAYGTSLRLANGDDEIILEDANCGGGGTEIDRVEYDVGTVWPDPNGASMVFCFGSQDNNDGNQWAESDTATYGAGDFGTPGAQNDSCGANAIILSAFSAASKPAFLWTIGLGLLAAVVVGLGVVVVRRRI